MKVTNPLLRLMIHATMNRYAFQTILQSKYLRQTQDG